MTVDKTVRPEPPKGAVLLDGHVDVPAERVAAVMAALPEHIRLTRAEPGCLHFSVTPSNEVPGRLFVSETFVDQTAFDAHQARGAASPWAEATRGIPRSYDIRTA